MKRPPAALDPAECNADEQEQSGQTCGPSSRGSNHARQAFGDDLPRAFLVQTKEALLRQFQVDRTAYPGEISDRSYGTRGNPRYTPMAEGHSTSDTIALSVVQHVS
jgi:hypothetical protein